MNIRHLRYFTTIVEEGKISRAAKRLHMAQPPLSQQLKLLESELGVTLFERHTRKLIITDEGKLLYNRAKQILELMSGTLEEMKELSEGTKGTLSIGTIASLGAKLLPERIRNFQQQYAEVQFQVWEGDPIRIMELLENRIIELGIVRFPIDSSIFNMIHLPDEPLVVAMNPNRIIGNNPNTIELSELKEKPLMLLRRQKGTSMYNQDIYTVDILKDACLKNGFEPKIICESSDIMTLLIWANHDIGITIVPKSAINLIPNTELFFKEIINPTIMARPSALIWLKDRYLSQASRRFMEYFPIDQTNLKDSTY
ncbi:LysR family transcriptional regulator [Halalkalibacter krulwichiae]|uniref:HTH-type transcriptional regulator CatM n=1 Tax=Halalkalibacter krulwichiae TaxID=199441 RepID=A0A1X9M9W3_9BACI|nr:LysR family transcriptional regulator [Halalkalibacter krulwichiae]ARK30187.1 HTH-type transcriptional regulator CatM [Halalkalibacter krulwichiae]